MERTLIVQNEDGMHARPAGLFVKTANQFKSTIEVRAKGVVKNGKSIMSLMTLGAEKGAELTISAQGEDAEQALEALSKLV